MKEHRLLNMSLHHLIRILCVLIRVFLTQTLLVLKELLLLKFWIAVALVYHLRIPLPLNLISQYLSILNALLLKVILNLIGPIGLL